MTKGRGIRFFGGLAAALAVALAPSPAAAGCGPYGSISLNGPSSMDDRPLGIAVDPSGSVVVAGYVNASLDGEGNNWFVRKYSPGSAVIWSRTFNWSLDPLYSDDRATSVAVDSSGNVFVAGYVDRTSEGTLMDWMVLKLLPGGGLAWSRTYSSVWMGTNDDDRAMGIAVDPSGSVIAAGWESRSDVGENKNLLVIKYDGATGEVIWSASHNGSASGDDAAMAVAVDPAGDIRVAGYEFSPVASQFLLINYDPTGGAYWNATWNSGSAKNESALAVGVDASGSAYLAGYSGGFSEDAAILKYDPAGNLLWSVTEDGPVLGNDRATALTVRPNGDFFVGGYMDRSDLGHGRDWLVRRCDSGGAAVWEDAYDGPAHGGDGVLCMAASSATVLYSAGYESRTDVAQGDDWLVRSYPELVSCPEAELSAGSTAVEVGDEFTLTLTYLNGGNRQLISVSPVLSAAVGAGLVTRISGPVPASAAPLDAGDTATFTWRWRMDAPGAVTFSVTATGILGPSSLAVVASVGVLGVAPVPPPAGGAGTMGRDFWLAFPLDEAVATPEEFSVLIAAPSGASGTVEMPGVPWSESFTVPAGGSTTVYLPASAGVAVNDAAVSRAVHVTSGADIAVWGLDSHSGTAPQGVYSSDGFLALPTPLLGCEHLAAGFGSASKAATHFAVVAASDATNVTITPNATVGGRTKGVPYTVTLNQGQVYRLGINSGTDDLSGSVVSSDHPVGLVSGAYFTNIPATAPGDGSHLLEMVPPVKYWGTRFLSVPSEGRPLGDVIRVLSSANGTAVTVNGGTPVTVNRGAVLEFSLAEPAEIIANRPVLAAKYLTSGVVDGSLADPAFAILPAVDQYASSQSVVTPSSTLFASDYLGVVVPTGAVSSFRLDGSAVSATVFTPIFTSGYSGANLAASKGAHRLSASSAFGAVAYGYGQAGLQPPISRDAYAYPGGFAFASSGRLALAGPQSVERYKEATFTVSYWNREAQPADIEIQDTLPAGLACVSAGVSGTSYGSLVVWTLSSVPANSSGSVVLVVRAKGAPGSYATAVSASYSTATAACPVTMSAGPVTIAVTAPPAKPMQVYPNPFNPTTAVGGTVKFSRLKVGGQLRIFTITGQLVWEATAGVDPVEWDGKNKDGEKVVSGVYFWTGEGETGKQRGKVFVQR